MISWHLNERSEPVTVPDERVKEENSLAILKQVANAYGKEKKRYVRTPDVLDLA